LSIGNADGNSRVPTQARPARRSSGIRLAVIIAGLVLIPLAVFMPVTHFDFVSLDDPRNITDNPLYQPLPSDHFRQLWTEPYLQLYIPVTLLVWAGLADTVTDSGGAPSVSFDPHKYHLANLVVHILNVLLVFLIIRRLVLFAGSGNGSRSSSDASDRSDLSDATTVARGCTVPHLDPDWAAGFGALLFAVHPLQVEPVAWVTGMKDLLGAFFSFLAIFLYLLFMASRGKRKHWPIFAVATFCYFLALLAKPTAVVVLPVVLLIEYLSALRAGLDLPNSRRRIPTYSVGALAVWTAATIPIVAIAIHVAHPASAQVWHYPVAPTWQRPFVAGDAITFYLTKLLAPVSLAPDYGRTPVWLMVHRWACLRILVPLVLAAIAWRFRRRAVWPALALGVVILGLLPVSGLVPFEFQAYSTVADRYAYFILLGPALAFAGVLMLLSARPAWVTGAVVIAALAFLSARQVPVWSNTTTLFTQALRVNPRSPMAYVKMGAEMWNTGQFDAAVADYRMAVDSSAPGGPVRCQALVDLAAALIHEGETNSSSTRMSMFREARTYLDDAVRINGAWPLAHAYLGDVDYDLGLAADSASEWREAVQSDWSDPNVYYLLAMLYARNGRPDLALQPMQQAAKMGLATARQDLQTDPSSWK